MLTNVKRGISVCMKREFRLGSCSASSCWEPPPTPHALLLLLHRPLFCCSENFAISLLCSETHGFRVWVSEWVLQVSATVVSVSAQRAFSLCHCANYTNAEDAELPRCWDAGDAGVTIAISPAMHLRDTLDSLLRAKRPHLQIQLQMQIHLQIQMQIHFAGTVHSCRCGYTFCIYFCAAYGKSL